MEVAELERLIAAIIVLRRHENALAAAAGLSGADLERLRRLEEGYQAFLRVAPAEVVELIDRCGRG